MAANEEGGSSEQFFDPCTIGGDRTFRVEGREVYNHRCWRADSDFCFWGSYHLLPTVEMLYEDNYNEIRRHMLACKKGKSSGKNNPVDETSSEFDGKSCSKPLFF